MYNVHNSRVFTHGGNLRNQVNGVSKSILIMKLRVDYPEARVDKSLESPDIWRRYLPKQ